jgi:hypothetical protein
MKRDQTEGSEQMRRATPDPARKTRRISRRKEFGLNVALIRSTMSYLAAAYLSSKSLGAGLSGAKKNKRRMESNYEHRTNRSCSKKKRGTRAPYDPVASAGPGHSMRTESSSGMGRSARTSWLPHLSLERTHTTQIQKASGENLRNHLGSDNSNNERVTNETSYHRINQQSSHDRNTTTNTSRSDQKKTIQI